MQPRRLWMAVAIGFGLLATAPYRILAFPPPFLEEASTTFRTAADELGKNVQNPPPEYLFIRGAHFTAHNPDEGGHPLQQAVMPSFQHHQRPDTAQPAAQNYQPREYDFMSETRTRDAHNPTEGYSPHQVGMPSFQHHQRPDHAQPTAQNYQPREYHIISGADTTQGHIAYQSSYAPQHQPDPMDWEPQHAAPHYPAVGSSYPTYHEAQARNPGYSAANPVQLAAQHPALVQQEPGPSSRASLFGQAQGDDAASTLYPPSDAVGREGGSGGWFQANEQRPNYPAGTAGQFLGVEDRGRSEPVEAIADMQKSIKETDHDLFKLNRIKSSNDKIKGSRVWFLANQDQQDIVKELLEKRFGVKNVEFFRPVESSQMQNHERWDFAKRCKSLLAEPKDREWKFFSSRKDSFFFDLGEFRFRCHAITHGQYRNEDAEVYKLAVAGASKEGASRHLYLYVGIAKITRGQQEGSSSRRARKGKQQQQPEQLEQQQQQATDTDRQRARKGKQQQQPM
ncbi:hypothetical protein ACQY0O_007857 [Thecaphora frezii]